MEWKRSWKSIKIGLSSNAMEEELEINKKKEHKIFLPYSKFQTTPIQTV
jgi:hypothetical protein